MTKPTTKLQLPLTSSVRPTKKQQELLAYIEEFIGQHGYSPSYREIMNGLSYTSVATVALHVNSLISRGHLNKRDRSARSLEVVKNSDTKVAVAIIKPNEEKWLIDKVDGFIAALEAKEQVLKDEVDHLYVVIGALKVLGFDDAARAFIPRLSAIAVTTEWYNNPVNILDAILLGIIEGITEFLPVSSTGHLTIAEKLLGYKIDDPGITAFTAIIQAGAILATVIYFRRDITRIANAWVSGILNSKKRKTLDYRFGWAVIIGSLPIAVVGLLFKDQIETGLRSLWLVAFALIGWSAVMWLADKTASQTRNEADVKWKDTLYVGVAQCIALIPGVSRSGATMSAGLFRGFDRVTVTRLSFFLSIPALLAAGALQALTEYDKISTSVGWAPTIVATIVSFIVAYAAVAWLLKFIANHTLSVFIGYRVALGLVLIVLLTTGTISSV